MSNVESRYETLKSYLAGRRGQFDKLEEFLKEKTTYFIGPGSHKYHNNWEGGLLEHSCNVAENMLKIKNILAPDLSDESCVIVGLFHDLGKVGAPGQPYYILNEPTEKQKQYGYVTDVPYTHGDVQPYMPVPHRSLYFLTKFIDLTPEEFQAIMIHDGQYVDDNHSYACKESRLALIAHYADSWSGFVCEESCKKDVTGKRYVRKGDNKESDPSAYRYWGVWSKE